MSPEKSSSNPRFFTVVNPLAGSGRCGKQAGPALDRLRAAGVDFEVVETLHPGDAQKLVRQAARRGFRHFLAVGGDGTTFEMVNGLFPPEDEAIHPPPVLGFLPLGTGNSFLRDFSEKGAEDAFQAIVQGRCRPCDVLCMEHSAGTVHYINLLSMGFPADVATITNRQFKPLGHFGYWLGLFTCLIRLRREAFPLSVDNEKYIDRRRCLLLTFSNSKFTGGKMMLAPRAKTDDGLIEYVRWGPVGRIGTLTHLPGLYDGTHIQSPMAECRAVQRIDFHLAGPVDIMVDGEVLTIFPRALWVRPAALQVMI
jgi:diacylglycerol kinase (ATP)